MVVEDGLAGEDGIPGPAGVSGTVTPAISIVQAAQPGTLNVSTEGNIDWLSINGSATIPRQLANSALHSKSKGGWLALGFNWVQEGSTIFTQNEALQISSSVGDDTANAILTNSVLAQGVSNAAALINFGWKLIAPTSRKNISFLRIYCSVFSGECTITVTMPFSGLSTSLTFDPGAGAALTRMLTVQYIGEGDLNITALLTVNRGSTPNVKFQCATLANI
jgi:hypothetical protein